MDSGGYVPISLLAGFNRVKALTLDEALVREVTYLFRFHVNFFVSTFIVYSLLIQVYFGF